MYTGKYIWYMYMCICMYGRIHGKKCIFTYISVYMYIYIYIYIYVRLYACIYVGIYLYQNYFTICTQICIWVYTNVFKICTPIRIALPSTKVKVSACWIKPYNVRAIDSLYAQHLANIHIPFHKNAMQSKLACVKPRSHCADLEVPISTTWKIVENGMIGSWSRGNIVLPSWKSARSRNDRQWSRSQCDKVLL